MLVQAEVDALCVGNVKGDRVGGVEGIMTGGGYAVFVDDMFVYKWTLESKTARQDRGRSSAGVFAL